MQVADRWGACRRFRCEWVAICQRTLGSWVIACMHAYKYVRDSVPFNATQNAGEPLSRVHVVGCVRDRGRGYGAKAVV